MEFDGELGVASDEENDQEDDEGNKKIVTKEKIDKWCSMLENKTIRAFPSVAEALYSAILALDDTTNGEVNGNKQKAKEVHKLSK
jgi:hypothetical protein